MDCKLVMLLMLLWVSCFPEQTLTFTTSSGETGTSFLHNYTLYDNTTRPPIQPDTLSVSGGKDQEEMPLSLQRFNIIANVYILGVMEVFGIFGNIMIIIVLQKQGSKTSNSILLQALAISDMALVGCGITYFTLRSAGVLNEEAFRYMTAFVLPFGWTSQAINVWLIMAVSIDRYLVVSRPLQAASLCTRGNARKAILTIAVAGILFNAPRWPRYYLVAFGGEAKLYVAHTGASLPGWNEELYHNVYHVALTFTFMFVIPLSIMIVLNTRLVVYLKKYRQERKYLTSHAQDSNRIGEKKERVELPVPTPSTSKHTDTIASSSNVSSITIDSSAQSGLDSNPSTVNKQKMEANQHQSVNVTFMVTIIISVFIVCQVPDCALGIIGAGHFPVDPVFFQFLAGVNGLTLTLNSTVNFYLYCMFYHRFRKTLAEILGIKKRNESK